MPTTVCAERAQLATFLQKIHVESIGILCPQLNVNKNIVPFEPAAENPKLLKRWLEYRGVSNSLVREKSNVKLVSMTNKNFEESGNFPPFSGFTDFNPQQASTQFLKLWLSWYGVTSYEDKPHGWWVTRVDQLQSLINRRTPQDDNTLENMRAGFNTLVEIKRLISVTNNFYFQLNLCFSEYNDHDLVALGAIPSVPLEPLLDQPLSEDSDLRDALDDDYPKPEIKTAWNKKKLVAAALDASAIAIPLLLSRSSPTTQQSINSIKSKVVTALGIDKIHEKSSPAEDTSTKAEKVKAALQSNIKQVAIKKLKKQIFDNLFGKNTDWTHMASLGDDLLKDVSSILQGKGKPIPSNVVKRVAGKYLSQYPAILTGITDVVVPSLNVL